MAELDVRFGVAGLSTVTGGFATIAQEAKKSGATVASAGQQAAEATTRLSGSFASARQVVGSFASALSGAAAIASIFARNNEDLKRQLEVVSLALSAAGTAARGVMAAFTAITGVIGIKIAAIAALAGAVMFLVRHWDQALEIGRKLWANFAAFLGRVWAALAQTGMGLKDILAGAFTLDPARIQQGLEQFKTGLGQLGAIAKDVGGQVVGLAQAVWGKVVGLFGQAKKPVQEITKTFREFTDAIIENAAAAEMHRVLARGGSLDEAALAGAVVRQRLGEKLTNEELIRTLDALTEARKKGTDADIDWAKIEREQVNPAMRAAIDLFQRFKTPAEEGILPGLAGIDEDFDAVAKAAQQAQRVLGVDWTEALTVARQAMQLAKEEGISLADALARIKFNRDFLIELELVDSGMKKWFDAWGKIKEGADDFNINVAPSIGKALDPAIAKMEQLAAIAKEILVPAFTQLFTDLLSSAKDFGEAILDFFRNIVNDIIRLFAKFLALKVWTFLAPIFGLAQGGIVTGGLMPILAAQAGGVIDRPTLALVGEGRQSEAVVPLPDNRSIPVKFMDGRQARGDGGREAIIHLTIHNVIGDPRALGIPTAGDIAGVIVNDVSRRGPTIQAIRVALA